MTRETVRLAEDAAHGIRATTVTDADDFFQKARPILHAKRPWIVEDVIPNLEQHEGKWHPLGFMVFPMGIIPDLGIMRLHAWPAGGRQIRGTGPGIHEHGWHLISQDYVGNFSDEIHELEAVDVSSEAGRKAAKALTSFTVQYTKGKPDALVPDGSTFRTRVTERRKLQPGEIHTIDAGVFHVSNIPENEVVATLVLDSLAFFSPRVLLDAPQEPIYDSRQLVTSEQALYVKEQLMQRL